MLTIVSCLAIFILTFIYWPRAIKIQRVVDGDSLEAVYRGRSVRIRIAGYDAPEYRQPGGREARSALARLTQTRTVRMLRPRRDRYNRLLGTCWVGKLPVSWHMILAGHGWPATRVGLLLSLVPRLKSRGLWSNRDYIHPSQWRSSQLPRHPLDI